MTWEAPLGIYPVPDTKLTGLLALVTVCQTKPPAVEFIVITFPTADVFVSRPPLIWRTLRNAVAFPESAWKMIGISGLSVTAFIWPA